MAHAFDTSLASAQRTLIRNGAVTLLSGLLRPAGYLAAVIPWGGIVRGYTDEDGIGILWEALAGRAPAIAIALGDAVISHSTIGGFNFTAQLELVAYHYSSNPRDMESGRLSIDVAGLANSAADPGLDVMLEHASELLIGQRCGASATIKQIVPTREEELFTEHGLTLWAQRYSVTIARKINAYRSISQLVEEFRSVVHTTDPVSEPTNIELQLSIP